MKIRVEGGKGLYGTSKAGNPTDFATLNVSMVCESKELAKMSITGFGREAAEMRLDPKAIPSFKALEGKFPIELELITDQVFMFGRFESVVTGFKPIVAAAAPLSKSA